MNTLEQIIHNKKLPHLIFYSHDTEANILRLRTFLTDMFPDIGRPQCVQREFKVESKVIVVPYFSSKYHIELSINDFGYRSRVILPELINDLAKTKNIGNGSQKIIVLHDVQNLDKQTQYMMRYTFETSMKNCRIILLTTSINCLIEPLQSRCVIIRTESDNIAMDKRIFQFMDHIEDLSFPQINEVLYSYMAKNISYTYVLEYILKWLVQQPSFSQEFVLKITKKIAYYDYIMKISNREFIHMQSFIAEYLYERSLIE